MFDLRSIVLLVGQGRGIEHVSQHSPGWPLNCHNLPASASEVLGYKQYELNVAQDFREPHSTLHTMLGCGVLGEELGESLVTVDPKSKIVSSPAVGRSKSSSPCKSLHKKVKPGFPERLQGALC